MIVHIINPVFPYELGKVYTVSESTGASLTRSDESNDYTPSAKKITKAIGDKIIKENLEMTKEDAVKTKRIPVKFSKDVFPYDKGQIVLMQKKRARTLMIEQKAVEIKRISVEFTINEKAYKIGQIKEFPLDEANEYIDNKKAIKVKNSERE